MCCTLLCCIEIDILFYLFFYESQVMEEPENGNNGNADIAVEGPVAAEPEVTAAAESSDVATEEGKVDEVIIPTITESSEGIAEPEASPRASPSPIEAVENVEAAVKGPTRSAELNKLWKTVEANPSDFTGWTYLLQHVDGVEVELGREAYDAFLFRYPYCYGYWKKYADLEKKKGSKVKYKCQIKWRNAIIFAGRKTRFFRQFGDNCH